MGPGPRLGARTALALRRALGRVVRGTLEVLARVLPALPTEVVVLLADAAGLVLWALDRRGRSVGMQNLEVAFGAERGRAWRRRTLRASYRHAARTEALLFHLQPLTAERFARHVVITPEDEARFRAWVGAGWRGVLVSAHLGNWELLLAARTGVPYAPAFAYLAESTGWPEVDAVLERLRDRGAGGGALRKRGALALKQAFREGRSVSFLMDRNLRGDQGGVYVPFLGLPARTTPLAAMLAQSFGAPLSVILLQPEGRLRWRLTISPNLMPPPSDDLQADRTEALRRANEVLSEAIRAHPEAYLWVLKRWKGRPTPEQGRYPPYSYPDP